MKDLLLFVSAILVYFALAYGLYRIYRWNFISNAQDESSRQSSILVVSGLMTACSLAVVLAFNKPFLAMPGAYAGLVMSMLLGGERHGPGDQYSWMLFAAPTNFVLYYWLVRTVAKRFPTFF
jgi:Kef-type K+ transport system membrane component KefB